MRLVHFVDGLYKITLDSDKNTLVLTEGGSGKAFICFDRF